MTQALAAHKIQARNAPAFTCCPDDERAAVEEGLSQARRGEFATDAEVEKVWGKPSLALP